MSTASVFLCGPAYVLGEHEADHTEIENLAELAARFKLAPRPELWGWGTVRTTTRDLADLAAESGRATLDAAGLAPGAIDALVLCSNRIPGPAEGHGEFVASVLTGVGLGDIPAYGVNLNRCVNLLAGIDVAHAFVTSGRYRTVLVITTDKVADDADRMSQFALFSDAAASAVLARGDHPPEPPCVRGADRRRLPSSPKTGSSVQAAPRPGPASPLLPPVTHFELLGCATAQRTGELEWGNQISSDLAKEVNGELLAGSGLKVGDVAALMHASLFKPLVVMKERQAGFAMEQLYLGNVTRLGHCFAADPLINLVDRMALGHVAAGSYCMLACSVPGSRIGVLLRAVAGERG